MQTHPALRPVGHLWSEEREHIRNQHHEQMKIQAKKNGLSLPDELPAGGSSMGLGGGMGAGGKRERD